MAFSIHNNSQVTPGKHGKTTSTATGAASGNGASASKADAKPTRRSARGSDVAKQEKRAKKTRRAEQKTAAEQRAAAGKRAAAEKKVAKGSAGKRVRGKKDSSSDSTSSAASQRAFLKYANDNAIVRWFYQLTTGPQGKLFYLVVAAFIALGIYLPVRDFYIANRTAQILQEQKAIRDKYNDTVGEEVKTYLSQEGVEDAARKDLNMVMPGEQTIDVEGLDEDGNPVVVQEGTDGGATDGSTGDASADDSSTAGASGDASANDGSTGAASGSGSNSGSSSDSSDEDSGKLKGADAADKDKTGTDTQAYDSSKDPTTSAEVEAAEKAVFENSPWYWKVLDVLFFFDGVNGMAVVSTGE